jgi:hypothetical protein
MFNTAVVIDDVVVVDVAVVVVDGGHSDAVAPRFHRNVGRRLRFIRHRPIRTQDDLKIKLICLIYSNRNLEFAFVIFVKYNHIGLV